MKAAATTWHWKVLDYCNHSSEYPVQELPVVAFTHCSFHNACCDICWGIKTVQQLVSRLPGTYVRAQSRAWALELRFPLCPLLSQQRCPSLLAVRQPWFATRR